MIPSINDFTSHWNFGDSHLSKKYIGILFGENTLVYNNQVVNLSRLFNDNGRIHNAIYDKDQIYVLLNNNNLHTIKTTNLKTHELICRDVKNIFTYSCATFILKNNGDILDNDLVLIHKNIDVVTNIPRRCSVYNNVRVCDNNNNLFRFMSTLEPIKKIQHNINNITDICIVFEVCIMLCNNNVVICDLDNNVMTDNNEELKNVNCVSAIAYDKIGIIFDNNNIVIYEIYDYGINFKDQKSYKSISIPNSPYCAKFNTQNIPYYPKYFMDRFIAFIMSVKYGCNIKLPKYLYFMIADYLR